MLLKCGITEHCGQPPVGTVYIQDEAWGWVRSSNVGRDSNKGSADFSLATGRLGTPAGPPPRRSRSR